MQKSHLIVKQAALGPDEVIEEELEVTKSIKHLFDKVMQPLTEQVSKTHAN